MWLNQLTVKLKYNSLKILHSIEIKKKQRYFWKQYLRETEIILLKNMMLNA